MLAHKDVPEYLLHVKVGVDFQLEKFFFHLICNFHKPGYTMRYNLVLFWFVIELLLLVIVYSSRLF